MKSDKIHQRGENWGLLIKQDHRLEANQILISYYSFQIDYFIMPYY